jgi:cytidine deaminase
MSAQTKDITKELLETAQKAAAMAYAPYSQFYVGAALLTHKGNIYSGCNVENASYGLTICAERNAIFSAINAEGPGMKISKMVVITSNHSAASPCGACRQVISEFSDKENNSTEIYFNKKEGLVCKKINELLPDSFEFE